MNSKDLKIYGFEVWMPLDEQMIKSLPPEHGVYVMRLNRVFGRLKGESDILYVGSTDDLHQRIVNNYWRGRGGETTKRIRNYLFSKNYLSQVEVSWVVCQSPKNLEAKILERYENEHHELPPWNRQK